MEDSPAYGIGREFALDIMADVARPPEPRRMPTETERWLQQIAETLKHTHMQQLIMLLRQGSLTAEDALLGIATLRAYDDFRIRAENAIRQEGAS